MTALPTNLKVDRTQLLSSICRDSFEHFVRTFWEFVPGAETLVWNWHLAVFCHELEVLAGRVFARKAKEYDVICNVPPGTSKSSIWSILFPAWVWTRMPTARFICSSHTSELVLDLAGKSRDVIRSPLYEQLFPEIQIKEDQDAKGNYANGQGGSRLSCTVAGKTPTGFHGHFLICFPENTLIITDRGSLPIGEIVRSRLPVKVLGVNHESSSMEWQEIEKFEENPGRVTCEIYFSDGSVLEVTEDHPVFVLDRGYVCAKDLLPGDEVVYVVSLQELWEGIQQGSSTCCKGEKRLDLLFPLMQSRVHERTKPSQVQFNLQKVQELWEGDQSTEEEKGKKLLLQSSVQRENFERGESLQNSETLQSKVYGLSCNHESDKETTTRREILQKVLLKGVCSSTSFKENDGAGESSLDSWELSRELFQRVCKQKEGNQEERKKLLFSLWKNKEGEQRGAKCPPYRLQQGTQLQTKSGGSLSELSCQRAWNSEPSFQASKKVVSFVKREVRIPSKVYNIRTIEHHNYFAEGILVHNCDDPLDPQRAVSEAELNTAAKFCTSIITTRKTDKNITVLCLIMQRVHVRDPTAAMLEVAEKEGAAKIRHICLPAEESDEISPPELREKYTDGLLDPVRLGSIVLAEAKANLGEYDYSSQFGQNPKVLAGGMFREEYFNKRVRVAPYNCVRVRFWDRAATESGGAYTAGVLIGRDSEGNCFVEDCIHGQWETGRREEIQLAAAQRDRSKYGPAHEPRIYIEHEPGSAGVDAYRATARKLAGFKVFPIHPTGSKDTRAEPWSSQCAAGNVFLVDNGESDGLGKARWDLNGYILEHCLFRPEPGKRLGKWKDRVDASSGAFNVLFGVRSLQGLRTYSFGGKKPYKGQRCVIVTRDELVNAVFEQKSILISLSDPDPVGTCEIPPHSLPTLLDSLLLQFANINPESHQESWEDPVEAYGKRPEELIVNSQIGKKLWSFLLRKREVIPQVVVFCDDDEDRALSLVMAVCDVLRLPRNSSIYLHSKPEDKITSENKPPNNHIYQMIRNTRGGVVA